MQVEGSQERGNIMADVESACRTCIACRKSYLPKDMLRFVVDFNNDLVFDVKGHAPGRGAYVCAQISCLKNAVQRKAFNRSFKETICVDFASLLSFATEMLQKRILENLGLAYCAGQCVVGRTKAQEDGIFEKMAALIVASDLSMRSVKELDLNTEKDTRDILILKGPVKNLIGQALGRPLTGVVALLKGRISDRIVCDLQRWQSLSVSASE